MHASCSLSNNKFSDISELSSALTGNTKLTQLKFVAFFVAIAVLLKKNSYSLSHNCISDISALGAILADNTTLVELK